MAIKVEGATFLTKHFLSPDGKGWPRLIDVYIKNGSREDFMLLPKTHRVLADGSRSTKSLPTAVTVREFTEALRSAELYLKQVSIPKPRERRA